MPAGTVLKLARVDKREEGFLKRVIGAHICHSLFELNERVRDARSQGKSVSIWIDPSILGKCEQNYSEIKRQYPSADVWLVTPEAFEIHRTGLQPL